MRTKSDRAQDRETKAQTVTAVDIRNALQQLALEFEALERQWGANTQNKNAVYNNLCRLNGDFIRDAFKAGRLAKISALAALTNPQRDTKFLLLDLTEALADDRPARFFGTAHDVALMAATALKILADELLPDGRTVLDAERWGKRLMQKSPRMTLRKFAERLKMPETSAARLTCWKKRAYKNRARSSVLATPVKPNNPSTAPAAAPSVKESAPATPVEPFKLNLMAAESVAAAKERAEQIDRLIDEQNVCNRSRRVR